MWEKENGNNGCSGATTTSEGKFHSVYWLLSIILVLGIIMGLTGPMVLASIPSASAESVTTIGDDDGTNDNGDSANGDDLDIDDDAMGNDTSINMSDTVDGQEKQESSNDTSTGASDTVDPSEAVRRMPAPDYSVNSVGGVDSDNSADNVDGAGAPEDVTWHDRFEGTGAAVSGLTVENVISGTAPFDKDNEKGNDSGPDNDVIRSYDTAVYDIDYTLSSDPRDNGLVMDYYKSARVGFEFLIPADKNASGYKLRFDKTNMGWMDSTDGYAASSGTDVVTFNGKQYLSLKAYRLLSSESGNDWVIPGNATVRLVVNVRGAQDGYRFAPIVRAWLDGDADRTRMVSHTAPELRVSAKLKLNITAHGANAPVGYYDFNTGNDKATNKEYGSVFGKRTVALIGVDMRWEDRTKGMRGLEAPVGEIKYRVKVSALSRDQSDDTYHAPEKWYQPMLHQINTDWGRTPDNRIDNSYIASPCPGHYGVSTGSCVKTTTNTITEERRDDGTYLDVTFSGYDVDNFPNRIANTDCSTVMVSSGCAQVEVAEIHAAYIGVIIPLRNDEGTTISDYYGDDQAIAFDVHDGRLVARSESGQTLNAESDLDDGVPNNKNQSLTSDDYSRIGFPAYLAGNWEQLIRYSCGTENQMSGRAWSDTYTDVCKDWTNPDWGEFSPNGVSGSWHTNAGGDKGNGSDTQMPGKFVDVTVGVQHTLGTDLGTWQAAGMTLVKFNPDVLEYRYKDIEEETKNPSLLKVVGLKFWENMETPNYMNGTQINAPASQKTNKIQWMWATKKDGKDWVNVDESKKASFDDLNFYDTYAEAEKHGVVLAAVWGASMGFARDTMIGARLANTAWLRLKVRDDAKPGDVAVVTAESVGWTRSDLGEYTGLDPEASDEEWASKIKDLGVSGMLDQFYDKIPASRHVAGTNYKESKYNADGSYNGGDTTGTIYGDTLRVTGERIFASKTTAQETNDESKKIYDMDRSERTVDWMLGAEVQTGLAGANVSETTDVMVTDTLPEGLTYIPGSSYLNGTYTENTPSAGTVTGGSSVEPDSVKKQSNGTTIIKWTLHDVETNVQNKLYYSTSIGDTFNMDNDVDNGDQLLNTVTMQSSGDRSSTARGTGRYASYGITISKLKQNALAIRANQLIVDTNAPIKYTTQYLNTGVNTMTEATNVHILPSRQSGSQYEGNWTLDGLTITGSPSGSLSEPVVYMTNDANVLEWEPSNVNRSTITGSWEKVPLMDNGDGTYTATGIDSISSPVAYAVLTDNLEPGHGFSTEVTIVPTNNKAGNSYVTTWMDDRNSVDAVSAVASRTVNGHVWYDRNGNGIRETDDLLIPNASVMLVDKDNNIVKDPYTGKQIGTVHTDDHGYFQIEGVPAGTGYRLMVKPADNTTWGQLEITLKNAPGSTEELDSDADAINGTGGLTGATVSLGEFPTVDKMDSMRFVMSDQDTGIRGRLPLNGTPAVVLTRKVLTGRQFLPGEQFVSVIVPQKNAPIGGLVGNDDSNPIQILYTKNNETIPLGIDDTLLTEPGTYTYRVAEIDTRANAVTYDNTAYIVTISVAEDMRTMTRAYSTRITKENDSAHTSQDAIVFTNKYTGRISDLPMTGANSLIPIIVLGTIIITMLGVNIKRRVQM